MAVITQALARAAAKAKKLIPRRLALSKPEAKDPIPSDDRLQKLAYHYHQAHAKKHGLGGDYHGEDLPYVADDDHLRQRIADHYESVKHAPHDPNVAAAFHQYKKEIRDQYNFLTKHGFRFDETKPGEHAASPSAEEMVAHVRKNRHLSVFGGGMPPKDHPLSEPFPERPGWNYNHAFRAVHDVFGHAVEGNDFSNRGETNASFAHAKMFSPLARKAMLADTLGQNAAYSHGKNSHLPESDPKRFPEQKAYLFPDDLVPGALRSGGPRPVSPHPRRVGKLVFGKSAEAGLVLKGAYFWRGFIGPRGEMIGGHGTHDDIAEQHLKAHPEMEKEGVSGYPLRRLLAYGHVRAEAGPSAVSVETATHPTRRQLEAIDDLRAGNPGADFFWDHGDRGRKLEGGSSYEGFRKFHASQRASPPAASSLVLKAQVRGYTRTRGGKTVMVRAYERRAPVFTSYGAEVAASRLPNRAKPEQVLGTLRGAGVREEELQESGLHGMLARAKGPVERGAVVRKLENGQPKINEVVYRFDDAAKPNPYVRPMEYAHSELYAKLESAWMGGFKPEDPLLRDMFHRGALHEVVDRIRAGSVPVSDLPLEVQSPAERYIGATKRFTDFERREGRKAPAGKPHYASYTLPGGGGYHELLLTLPPTDTENYESAHWPDQNVLAHVRFKEHTGSDGKRVLLVEEVQSDWHQAGREHGYRGDLLREAKEARSRWEATIAPYEAARQKLEAASGIRARLNEIRAAERLRPKKWEVLDTDKNEVIGQWDDKVDAAVAAHDLRQQGRHVFISEEMGDYGEEWRKLNAEFTPIYQEYGRAKGDYEDAKAAYQHARSRLTGTTGEAAVPDAPFKKTWHELVMKRMLRWAGEHGFDRIAWTTGKQQNDRYGLSVVGKTLELRAGEHGTPYELLVHPHTAGTGPRTFPLESLDKLDDYVGHAVANTMRDALAEREAAGLDFVQMPTNGLEVGGQGMRGFYDKILPEFMGKYTKRWGGKVGTTSIATRPAYGFKKADGQMATDDAGNVLGYADPQSATYAFEGMAGEVVPYPAGWQVVHSVDITPEMREHVMKHGQYLFKAERPALFFKAGDHWRDEPRHPAGTHEGGRWTRGGSLSEEIEAEPPNVSFELAHGEGSPYAAKYPTLYNLCFRTNYAVTRAVMDHVTHVALEESGAEAVEAIYGPGGYQTYPVVPSGQLKVREDAHKVGVLADIIGYLAQQTEVFIHDPDRNGDHEGIQIVQNDGDDLSHPKALQAFWNRLHELAPEIAQGFSPARHKGRFGIRIINSDAPWTEEQVAKFTAVVNQLDDEFGYDLEAGRFHCFFERHKNDWTENPDGKAYLDSLAASGRPDLQRRLQRVYRPETERWIEDALRIHAPRTYRAWAKGRHVGEGETESLGLTKSGLFVLKAVTARSARISEALVKMHGVIEPSEAPIEGERHGVYGGYILPDGRLTGGISSKWGGHHNSWPAAGGSKKDIYYDMGATGHARVRQGPALSGEEGVMVDLPHRFTSAQLSTVARLHNAYGHSYVTHHSLDSGGDSWPKVRGELTDRVSKAVAPSGSLVEVGRQFPRRAHQMRTASGKVVWVREQWVSARGHREPQQALPAASEQLALPRARFRPETPLVMPHPAVREATDEEQDARVKRDKARLSALAGEREDAPYSPLDFAERITEVERGGPKETVERTAQWIERAAIDQYGKSPFVGSKKYVTDPKTGKRKLQRVSDEEIGRYVSPKMVDDILWQLEQEHSGSDWYKTDLKYVREQLPEIYPEMKADPTLQKLFWMLLPPTSYGSNPKTNFSAAHNIYRHFLRTGVLLPRQPVKQTVAGKPTEKQKGWTMRSEAVANAVTSLNRLRERFKSEGDPEGFSGAFHWLETKHPVSELEEVRGGAPLGKDTEDYPTENGAQAYGAMIFGPKGGSFFLNLTGNMEPLTADMWFTRSWGRYLGDVTDVASDVGTGDARAGHAKIPKPQWPTVVTERPIGDPRSSQRPAMRAAIKIVSREVSKAMGREVTPAECQAALWYYEQDLWAVMGADTHGYSYMDGVEYARLRKMMDDEAEKNGDDLTGLSSDDKLFQRYSNRVYPEALRRAGAALYRPSPTARREDAVARHFDAGAEGGPKGSARQQVRKMAFLTRKNPRGESILQKRLAFRRVRLVFQL